MFLGTGQLASVLADVAQLDFAWEYSSFECAGSVWGTHNYLKIFISFAFHLNNCAAIFTDY